MKICRESFVHLNFTIALVLKALTELRRVKDGNVGYGFLLNCSFGFDLIFQRCLKRWKRDIFFGRIQWFLGFGKRKSFCWTTYMLWMEDRKRIWKLQKMLKWQPHNALDLYGCFRNKVYGTFILGIIPASSQWLPVRYMCMQKVEA
ncbi:hypothetical protein POTOM_037711 [Populus tomentosa]|uniref:Uncharacterized protein n=1 Tax=Populus tomentosa TaxID=118781 RepID=A0A8X8CCU0_POPTO|nr:hypothetical protein POTOM_037711 [Populus tomentosa]